MCSVAQLCPILCDPVDCNPPGSSVCGIFWPCPSPTPGIHSNSYPLSKYQYLWDQVVLSNLSCKKKWLPCFLGTQTPRRPPLERVPATTYLCSPTNHRKRLLAVVLLEPDITTPKGLTVRDLGMFLGWLSNTDIIKSKTA